MMNPFIASLMQQAEQASKQALEDQNQGFALPVMGFGGGLFGGGPQGDVSGGMPSAPLTIAPGSGDLRFKLADAYANGVQPASFVPTAPIEPTYSPPPLAPSAPQDNGYMSPPAMSAPEPTGIIPVAPPEPVNPMRTMWPDNISGGAVDVSPADAAAGALAEQELNPVEPVTGGGFALGYEPFDMSKYLEWSGRDLDMTPEQYRQEGVAMPDWGYVKPYEGFGVTLSDRGWNGTQAVVDPSLGGLSGMMRAGYEDRISDLLEGPYMEAQRRFGEPIPILDALAKEGTSRERDTQGSRHFYGDALDFDIMGFDNARRLDLLDALTAAGFTDFGLGANSLHGDKRGRGGNWSYGGGYGGLSYADAVARLNRGRQAYAAGKVPPLAPEPEWVTSTGLMAPGGDFLGIEPQPTQFAAGPFNMPTGGVEGIVASAFQQAGYDPLMGLAFASIESGVNPAAKGGNTYWGLFQNDRNAMEAAGLDWSSAEDSTAYALQNMGKTVPYFRKQTGRDPEPYEIYLLHQQGIAGGTGLARYPDLPAWEAIQRQAPSLSESRARQHISANLGDPDAPAREFTDLWKRKFNSHYDKFASRYGVPAENPAAYDPVAVGVPSAVPSVGALPDDDWQSPYNNQNMAIFGGVSSPGGYLYHDWEPRPKEGDHRWSHDNAYRDYSQFFRDVRLVPPGAQPPQGFVKIGERAEGEVFAAPQPEYLPYDEQGNYVDGGPLAPVSREIYWKEAMRRGGVIPTEDEMRALYALGTPVKMPTIPNGGGPSDRIAFDNVPDGPWYGPKEFYRTNDSPALPLPANFAEAMQNPAILAQILLGGY